jgi:hypothetical protein
MRLAFCVAIKNRSHVIVDPEDSLSFLQHVRDKIGGCPQDRIEPERDGDGKIVLHLMPKMLRSLARLKKPEDDWVLVVVDYKSNDIDMRLLLEKEIGDRMPWHLEVVEDYAFFDRGGGLDKGVKIAESKFGADAVFFCDADLEFRQRDVIDAAIQSVSKNRFFYPIFWSYSLADHTLGLWRDTSFGNFACCIEDYKKTEGWYHNISWGWEDRALADSIPKEKIDRAAYPGFVHQWHPLQWEFRVKEYPVKQYIFKDAAVKQLLF